MTTNNRDRTGLRQRTMYERRRYHLLEAVVTFPYTNIRYTMILKEGKTDSIQPNHKQLPRMGLFIQRRGKENDESS